MYFGRTSLDDLPPQSCKICRFQEEKGQKRHYDNGEGLKKSQTGHGLTHLLPYDTHPLLQTDSLVGSVLNQHCLCP